MPKIPANPCSPTAVIVTATIAKVVLARQVVCSDETSVRVKGKIWWERVFIGTRAVPHIIEPICGKVVVTDLFGAHRPEVWILDMLGSQRGTRQRL